MNSMRPARRLHLQQSWHRALQALALMVAPTGVHAAPAADSVRRGRSIVLPRYGADPEDCE